jgi:hypothetical protein
MDEDGLRRTFGDLHRRYAAYVNASNQWISAGDETKAKRNFN